MRLWSEKSGKQDPGGLHRSTNPCIVMPSADVIMKQGVVDVPLDMSWVFSLVDVFSFGLLDCYSFGHLVGTGFNHGSSSHIRARTRQSQSNRYHDPMQRGVIRTQSQSQNGIRPQAPFIQRDKQQASERSQTFETPNNHHNIHRGRLKAMASTNNPSQANS